MKLIICSLVDVFEMYMALKHGRSFVSASVCAKVHTFKPHLVNLLFQLVQVVLNRLVDGGETQLVLIPVHDCD